jgi:predicted MFS family arabinose efflux permease
MTAAHTAPDDTLSRGLMTLLLLACFVVAGTIHYQTPMLDAIAAEFHANAAAVGWVPTLSFGGLLAGNVLLAPLGDRMDKRTLILAEITVLIAALVVMACAPSIAVLAAASFVVGAASSLPQVFIPVVAELAPPEVRARTVGTLLTALFTGILFARIAGGLIATHLGWRWSYVLSTAMIVAMLPLLVLRLPRMPPATRIQYGELLWSIVQLLRRHAVLRRLGAIQFLLGLCYGGFWATVAPMMSSLHRLGPTASGLIGIPGAAGILVARGAGRWMDRRGAVPVVASGLCIMIAAWVAFSFSAWSLAAVIAGAILLDCGLRATMVANQTLANVTAPEARSRANTIFAAHVWAGNAVGAFAGSSAFAHFGWTGVCTLALSASALALLIHLAGVRADRVG